MVKTYRSSKSEEITPKNLAPEFVLVSPDLSPSMAYVVQPLAAAGNVINVDMFEDREAQDVFEQLSRQVGQFFC